MPLNDEAQNIFLKYNGIPLVGLINKNTYEIILAPCIPEKICLTIDTNGNATSAYFIDDDLSKLEDCSDNQLEHYNSLLQEKFVPRLATTPSINLKSSHQFLFEQYNLTKKSEWGGFAVTAESTGNLKYAFASGAFNSPPNQRIKGAQLSENLQAEVKQQIDGFSAELLDQKHHIPEPSDKDIVVSPHGSSVQP